ncbi:MAG: Gas vesicle protein GvpA [Candidatus Magnetoglobus multicellularis str. Araruama]|uniref:Gas vesicle protein GvpA n=1 Tax=Candidatus Magnetoglobus multicellularis str. Araruama TaxID=890399 RepID=A0A1V1PBJ0_9BACT|nr:MAG: Gas vesicle protein GvpA [Candidatus Magnetoglobus multicellularis str. Araruama]
MGTRRMQQSLESSNLADILERILDKGIVIAGDIRINLVNVELLTIQLRLVICSVDKAKEMGMDWWVNNPAFSSRARQPQIEEQKQLDTINALDKIVERVENLEKSYRKLDENDAK